MEMRQFESGKIKLSVVLAAALGIGFLASGYLNFYQHQQAAQQQALLNGTITDLKYQVNQDHASPSPSASLLPTTEPSPSPSAGAVAGSQSVSISQWNVHLTVTDPISDLTFGMVTDGRYQVAGFTSANLLAKYPTCKPGALGELIRWPAGTAAHAGDVDLHKSIGGYNYYYKNPIFSCVSDNDGRNAVAADKAAVVNAALPTLSQ
jgi:hypothetical protein